MRRTAAARQGSRSRCLLPQEGFSRLTLLSLFLSLSLMLFFVELRLPLSLAVPGFKIGLANIVTVLALVCFRPGEALLLLTARIFLASFLAGSVAALSFSLAGGLLALGGGMAALYFFPRLPLWLLGLVGAVCHNLGQLLAAWLWLASADVFYYAPVLFALSCLAGPATGFLAQAVLQRIRQ